MPEDREVIEVCGMTFKYAGRGLYTCDGIDLRRESTGEWLAESLGPYMCELGDTPEAACLALSATVRQAALELCAMADKLAHKSGDGHAPAERDYFRDVLERVKRDIDKALQAPEGTKHK